MDKDLHMDKGVVGAYGPFITAFHNPKSIDWIKICILACQKEKSSPSNKGGLFKDAPSLKVICFEFILVILKKILCKLQEPTLDTNCNTPRCTVDSCITKKGVELGDLKISLSKSELKIYLDSILNNFITETCFTPFLKC